MLNSLQLNPQKKARYTNPVSILLPNILVTSLEGLTVMFYQTDEPNEVGFVQSFFDESGANYDVNLTSPEIVAPVTLSINETTPG